MNHLNTFVSVQLFSKLNYTTPLNNIWVPLQPGIFHLYLHTWNHILQPIFFQDVFDNLIIHTGQIMEAGRPGKRVYRLVLTGGMYCQSVLVGFNFHIFIEFNMRSRLSHACIIYLPYVAHQSRSRRHVCSFRLSVMVLCVLVHARACMWLGTRKKTLIYLLA